MTNFMTSALFEYHLYFYLLDMKVSSLIPSETCPRQNILNHRFSVLAIFTLNQMCNCQNRFQNTAYLPRALDI